MLNSTLKYSLDFSTELNSTFLFGLYYRNIFLFLFFIDKDVTISKKVAKNVK
jgi:hypothetical protein